MKFPDYFKYNNKKPVISFEIFPPSSDAGMGNLTNELEQLSALNPDFITVTYGAMGTTQQRTLKIASIIKKRFGIESACHLTCVGASKKNLDTILTEIYDARINNIVAIRGDPPKGEEEFITPEDGFSYGNELVNHIREFESKRGESTHFGIAVGGYPEKHLEAPNMETDLSNLKRKVDSGADVIITQLFFDNKYYFDFVDKVRALGIDQPVVPGLMPILSTKQIKRISSMCGSSIPKKLRNKLESAIDNDEKAREIGINQCILQARELLEAGVPGIHFYVLNKSDHIKQIMNALSADIEKATKSVTASTNS